LQRTGFTNRQEGHRENGMADAVDQEIEPMRMGNWVWTHNPEHYATENFAKAKDHLTTSAPFEHTNIPKGFIWQDGWTMEGEMEQLKQGKPPANLKTNGDWGVY
jgi:hypothetical protein